MPILLDENEEGPTPGGCWYMTVFSDGNCFFRAVALRLCGTESRHAEVRRAVVDFIYDNWSAFWSNLTERGDCETYKSLMREPLLTKSDPRKHLAPPTSKGTRQAATSFVICYHVQRKRCTFFKARE